MTSLHCCPVPLSYRIKRNKKQDQEGNSEFGCIARRMDLVKEKEEASAKAYAKRKDQDFRNSWSQLSFEEDKEANDLTLGALRYLGSFP